MRATKSRLHTKEDEIVIVRGRGMLGRRLPHEEAFTEKYVVMFSMLDMMAPCRTWTGNGGREFAREYELDKYPIYVSLPRVDHEFAEYYLNVRILDTINGGPL